MSFRLKTILSLAFLVTALFAILLASGMRYLAISAQTQLDARAAGLLGAYAALIRNELPDNTPAHLRADSQHFVAESGVVYVRVRDQDGRVVAESGPAAMLARAFRADSRLASVDDGIYDVGRVVGFGQVGAAWVELGIDVAELRADMVEARRSGIVMGLLGVLLATLFATAVGVHITRRLAELQEGARRLRDGELGYQVTLDGNDELSETAQTFNVMSRRLSDEHDKTVALLREREVERVNQRLELEKLVATRTAELFEAEAQASLILASSAAGMCGFDRDARITFINPAACQMLGYGHDQAIGVAASRLWHGQSARPVGMALDIAEAEPGHEAVLRHADGHPVEVILSTHPMVLNGMIVGRVLSFVDIGERKRAEAALKKSEREFRALADGLPDSISRYDLDCRMIYLNPALARSLHVPAERLLGHVVGTDDVGLLAFRRALETVLSDGRDLTLELAIGPEPAEGERPRLSLSPADAERDGWRIEHVRMVAEWDAAGEVAGVLVIGRDITGPRRLAAAREEALHAAEALARTKSAFLANMSHEIRTPLNTVLGIAQLGLRGSLTGKTRARFSAILDAGQLLLGVVDDILDFSKIEAGKMSLRHDTVDLGRLVDRAVDLVAARAWSKGLDILVDETPPLPERFLGDELRMAQILVNLLSNAVKFTETGGIYLGVELAGDTVVFTVTDTGIGMTEEQRSRLFTPFEQADGSTTRQFGGTGLGLAISKRLVELMAGWITVRSAPGEGAEFQVGIPVSGLEMPAAEPLGETISIAGLACAETLSEALNGRGVTAAILPADSALEVPCELAVLAYSLFEGRLLAKVREASHSGRRIAVVTPPGGLHAIPGDLRDRLILLDWPPRTRHVLRAVRAAPATCLPAPSGSGSDLAGLRILAAEDNELNRAILEEMLATAGARVVCVEDGLRLLERLRGDGAMAYDIVITDVQMPGMDGYQAAAAIRAMAPRLPILGLTAHALPEERARCLAAGMSTHLGKPFDLDTLVATLRGLAGREAAPPPTTNDTAPSMPLEDPVDWPALEASFPNKPDFIDKLCRIFLQGHVDTPMRLLLLRDRGDYAGLAGLTHNLKGVTGNLMALDISRQAAEVERAAKFGTAGAVDELADALTRMLASVRRRLTDS